MKVVLATNKDIETIMDLQLQLFKRWDTLDVIDKINERWFKSQKHKKNILDILSKKEKKIFLAVNEKPIGYVKAEILQREPFLKKVGYIAELYILPKFQGKGVGSLLLKKAWQWFRTEKLIWTTVSTHVLDKAARKFWHSKGYREFNCTLKMKL
ncbi:GNAT family N-acetyltransferase [Candidatus Woesearchaeota archaeon]|nr:GNAT family N-acetyltransferase [Candidatus Woesearchaeota archaeon]